MGIDKTSDDQFIFITLEDTNANTHYFADANFPNASFKLFNPLKKDNLIEVDHAHDHFYIMTNENGSENNKLMICPTDKIDRDNWKELIAHNSQQHLSSFDLFSTHLVLCYTDNEMALPKIAITSLKGGDIQFISMPDDAYDIEYYGAMEFDSNSFQYGYDSPIRPPETHAYQLVNSKVEIIKPGKCPNFNSKKYNVERVFAPAHDGEMIPLTIITQKDFKKDGTAKAFQYAYGSYGYSMPADFSSSRFSLIDRDYIYVIAHVRGGSDKGHQWYLDGKLNRKINTFKDFISCSEYLIEHNYCNAQNIVANGGSAGGLLMGAICNMRPDLYKSVILDVPFVDIVTTICDETLPLTPPEWNEWGNPITDEKAFNYMMSYSPYDNVGAKDYPNMLFNSGITDEQVTYWEPTKMVAKLRELKTDNNLLLLKMKMTAGHAGSSARYEAMKEQAFDFAFVLKTTK
jgi:oligopeptidase B